MTITTYKPYNLRAYGKVQKINMFQVLFTLDFVIPSLRLLTLIGLRFKHVIVLTITLHNKDLIGDDEIWIKNY